MVEVVALVVAHDPFAGRAPQPELEVGAAGPVVQAGAGTTGPGRPPLPEQVEGAGELAAVVGELVGEAHRPLLVGNTEQQAIGLEIPEPPGQHRRRDAVEAVLELAVAERAGPQRVEDPQRPPVGDPPGGEVEIVVGAGRAHAHEPATTCSRTRRRVVPYGPRWRHPSITPCSDLFGDSDLFSDSDRRHAGPMSSAAPSDTPAPTDPLTALEDAAVAVLERVGPSTVAVGRNGRGSGVVVAPGRILTNAHNLRDRTTQVTFADGRREQAAVTGADPHGDLVVLEVDTGDLPPVEFSDRPVRAGSVVFALARGLRGERIGFGLVSGTGRAFPGPRGRRINGGVEHNAPLARGSSGGPLVDRDGRLVGINTHRLGAGHYLAQPADDALRRRTETMAAGHDVERPTLGVAVAPPEVARRLRAAVGLDERSGLLVRGVTPEGAAARAGVREGDLLVSADGRDLGVVDDLFDVLDAADPAGALALGVVRGAEELTIAVALAPSTED